MSGGGGYHRAVCPQPDGMLLAHRNIHDVRPVPDSLKSRQDLVAVLRMVPGKKHRSYFRLFQ